MKHFLLTFAVFIIGFACHAQCVTPNPVSLGSSLNGHTLQGDANSSNKLISWTNTTGCSFDSFMQNLVSYMATNTSGITVTLNGSARPWWYAFPYSAEPGYLLVAADQVAEELQSALMWDTYSGSVALFAPAEAYVTYELTYGVVASGTYAGYPYAASCGDQENGSSLTCAANYTGEEPDTDFGTPVLNTIEPDKAANLGYQMVLDWELQGSPSGDYKGFLTAAKLIADDNHLMINGSPSSTVSPWPWRVTGTTGSVLTAYSANVISEIKLDTELINKCGSNCTSGELTNYAADVSAAKTWLLGSNGPIATHNWYNYYEDIGASTSNVVNAPALDCAIYLLQQGSSFDSSYLTEAEGIITYISGVIGQSGPGSSTTMEEQSIAYPYPTVDATARWAAANAWAAYRTTGATSAAYQDTAFRSYNYSTYWLLDTTTKQVYVGSSSGCCTVISQVWYRAGYPDVLPYFLTGIQTNRNWGNIYGGAFF